MRPGRAADHSPPPSAAVMEEYSYTSTHPLGHTGPVTEPLSHFTYIYIYTHIHTYIYIYTYMYVYIYIYVYVFFVSYILKTTCFGHFIWPLLGFEKFFKPIQEISKLNFK